MSSDTIVFTNGETLRRVPRFSGLARPRREVLQSFKRKVMSDMLVDLDLALDLKRRQNVQRDIVEFGSDETAASGPRYDTYMRTMRTELDELSKRVPRSIPLATPRRCAKDAPVGVANVGLRCYLNAVVQLLGSLRVMELKIGDDDDVWMAAIKFSNAREPRLTLGESFAATIVNLRTARISDPDIADQLDRLGTVVLGYDLPRPDDPLEIVDAVFRDLQALDRVQKLLCYEMVTYDEATNRVAVEPNQKTCRMDISMRRFRRDWAPQKDQMARRANLPRCTDLEFALLCMFPESVRDADNGQTTQQFPVTTQMHVAGVDPYDYPQQLGRNALWAFHLRWDTIDEPAEFSFPYTIRHNVKIGTLNVYEDGKTLTTFHELTDEFTNWMYTLRAVLVYASGRYVCYSRQHDRWWRLDNERVDDITDETDFTIGSLAHRDRRRSNVCALYYEHFMTDLTEGYYKGTRWIAQKKTALWQ